MTEKAATPVRIGVVSDTHGYLDPGIPDLFAGVDLIIHAGDIGDRAVLEALALLAPVVAVAGNLDTGGFAGSLPAEASGEIGTVRYVVGHKRKRLMKRLAAGKVGKGARGEDLSALDLVIFGHEHLPSAFWTDGTLFLNPGSASSPYEEDDTPTVAIVEAGETGLTVCFVPLAGRQQ